MIAFYVQGGGLGHLSRTDTLIQYLNIPSQEVLIITPSVFTHHFKQYSFVSISWEDSPETWFKNIVEQLIAYKIKVCHIDAFPLGIKGELIPVYKALPHISFKYVCRILKWEKYLKEMPKGDWPYFTETLLLEKIYASHETWVRKTSKVIRRISLKKPAVNPVALIASPYLMLVHSGGKNDVMALCQKVKEATEGLEIPVYVFTQVSVDFADERFHMRIQEYPVTQYFKHAKHIYTAAGFNLLCELATFKKQHTIFPLDRLYDDQYFRAKANNEIE